MKRFLSLLLLVLSLSSLALPAFAAGVETGVAGTIGEEETYNPNAYELPDDLQPENVLGVPNVTVDDLGNRLIDKGEDVVWLIKIVTRYICLGAFLLSCVFILVGIIGNRKILVSSILGAVISGVCYGAITCGEQIVAFIAAWAAS